MNKICMQLKGVQRFYGTKDNTLEILKDVNFTLKSGEIVALVGPSGSGKSTLLHIAGLLDTPTGGQIMIMDTDMTKANDKKRTQMRSKALGFVYQSHLLLPDFNALENVMMPQLLAGVSKKQAKQRALELLKAVNMDHRATHRSGQLSGGEQQRVAIARALANNPAILLADEPTGNLDPKTAESVFEILMTLVRQTGLSALIATHNPELAQRMDRQVYIQDGVLKEVVK